MKRILTFSFFTCFLSWSAISCTNNGTIKTTTTATTTSKVDSSIIGTRNANKIAAKSYYYKNLARLEKGKITLESDDWTNVIDKKIHFVVLYKANAPWAEVFKSGIFDITGNDEMNGLMASYDLKIIKQFSIDPSNEGIVIEPKIILENPIEAALKISMVEYVLLVNIKEVPTTNTTTVDPEK